MGTSIDHPRPRGYLASWTSVALRRSLGPFDLWSGLAGSAIALLDHFVPEARLVTTYGWQIPVFALAAVMLVRLVMAPYWIWQEQKRRIAELLSETDELKDRLSPKLEILFDANDPAYIHKTWFHRQDESQDDKVRQVLYVSVKVTAKSATPVDNVAGYLNKVWTLAENRWVPTQHTDRIALEWGASGYDPVSIDSVTNQHLNVFRIAKENPFIQPVQKKYLNKNEDIFDDRHGIYRLDVAVISSGGQHAEISLRVAQGTEWDEVDVSVI